MFEQMRQRLIEKAIRGQLVPQSDSEPEVEQIGETPEDEPFEIPEKWKWVQLRELVTYAKQKVPDRDFLYIDVSSIHKFSVLSPKRLSVSNAPSRARKIVQSGSVLFSTVRPYLMNVCVIDNVAEETIASTAFATMLCNKSINNKYLFYVLTSPFFTEYVKSVQRGVSYPAISDKDLQKSLIPLPPYNEQLRIVTKVEHLLVKTDKAEKAYNTLTGPLSEQYKALILDKAMRGQLVPQLDSEPEVEQMEESLEDVPFEIPKKWKWLKLSDVTLAISDGSHNPPPNSGKGIPVLSAKNIFDGKININQTNRWVTEEQWVAEDRKIHIEVNDVLLTIVGTIGRTAVVRNTEKFMLQRSVAILKPNQALLHSTYLALLMTTQKFMMWMNDRAVGTAQKGIYLKTLKSMPVPVPPLEEQYRIVKKLELLLDQVGRLSV